MMNHAFFQGLKKAVFGLYIWLEIVRQAIDSTGILSRESLNSWFPGLLYILLVVLYLIIDTSYQQKKQHVKPDPAMQHNRTWIIITVILAVIIGAVLHRIFQPTVHIGTLALAAVFFTVWLLEGRRQILLGFLAFVLTLIAFLPLLPLSEKYTWILPSFLIGAILIVMGVIEHLMLTRQLNELQS